MTTAALTTTPERLPYVGPTLRSIVAQHGVEWVLLLVESDLVDDAKAATAPYEKVKVCPVPNIGPGKKHLTRCFFEPDEIVVTFDDDHCYLPDHAAQLISAVETGSVAGFVGQRNDLSTVLEGPADWINGAQSWAYRAGWLDPNEVMQWGRRSECCWTDDIYIGAMFRREGRPIRVVRASDEYRLPPANVGAWVHTTSLRLHPERTARDAACMRAVANRF